MARDLPVAVCVPVRDEEVLLPDHLEALLALSRRNVPFTACFYLDGCEDGSEALLRDAARAAHFPIILTLGSRAVDANAGRARARAMAMGLEALSGSDGVLLSTDADSCPRADWIERSLAALSVADVAAGRIARSGAEGNDVQTRVERYYDRLHAYRRRVDPVPWERGGSHYGGGANMGFRSAAYQALGGFRPLAAGEDATMLDDAQRAGFRVRRDGDMVVETSARRWGRADGGLAAALRAIDVAGAPMVAPPGAQAWQYRAHAVARAAYPALDDDRAVVRLANAIHQSDDAVRAVARDSCNAEAFATRIVPAGPGHDRLIALDQAEAELVGLERSLATHGAAA